MRIIISIEHPAWAHQFRFVIKKLEEEGHSVKVLAINKDRDLELLEKFGISYELVGKSTGTNVINKAWLLFYITVKIFNKSRKFKPDLFIGRGSPMMAINSFLFGKPHIIFEDTEHSTISLFFCKLFSSLIITPFNFIKDLGKNHRRVHTFKELFYLHPEYFKPDPTILEELDIRPDEKYILLRFVAWTADHDFGFKGISYENRIKAIKEFEKFGKVFISSESALSDEFEKYKITLSPEKIHHLIYYATLIYGEGATMASEAAVLGTHSVLCTRTYMGYLKDQQENYNLSYIFGLDEESQLKSINQAVSLLNNPNLYEEGKVKRNKLISEKVDGTEYFLNLLNDYKKTIVG